MEIRIDERLVEVFNEVVEKDDKPFNGEKNLEKAINSHLADYFRFIDTENNNEFFSVEAKEKLLDFSIEDIEDDEVRRGLANLAKILLKKATNK